MEEKSFDQKNILERHTFNKEDGTKSFNIASALCEIDIKLKQIDERLQAVEQALEFFVKWYNETQKPNILIPESLANELEEGKKKIIL